MQAEKSFQIDFLVIGAQKCATTWLFKCLSGHPELHLPAHKREIWYLGGDLYEKNGADWYFGLLAGAKEGQRTGDVSVEYLFDPRAAPAVQVHAPQARFIVSLRDPIDRAISAYFWHLRKGAIDDIGVEESLTRGLDAVSTGTPAGDMYADMIRRGSYGEQLRRYTDRFGVGRIQYLLYEDIARSPLDSLQRVFRFLEVDEDFKPNGLRSRPKRNTYIETLARVQRLAPRSRLTAYAMDRLNRWLAGIRSSENAPRISPNLERQLQEYYARDLDTVRTLIDQAPPGHRPESDLAALWRTAA